MDDYEGFNEVHMRCFDATGPARTTVAVRALPHPHQLLMLKAVSRLAHRRFWKTVMARRPAQRHC